MKGFKIGDKVKVDLCDEKEPEDGIITNIFDTAIQVKIESSGEHINIPMISALIK